MYQENDIAICTLESGIQFVGAYLLAPGIDYFWNPLLPSGPGYNQLFDPVVDAVVIGVYNG